MDTAKRLVKLVLFVAVTIPGLVLTIIFRCAALLLCLFSPVVGLLAFGRPDNNYWGVMFSPLLLLGLPALMRLHQRGRTPWALA